MAGNEFYFGIWRFRMSEQHSETDNRRKYIIEPEKQFHDQRFADDSIRQKKVGIFHSVAQSIT